MMGWFFLAGTITWIVKIRQLKKPIKIKIWSRAIAILPGNVNVVNEGLGRLLEGFWPLCLAIYFIADRLTP